MKYDISIDLYADWIKTVRDLFRMNGQELPDDISHEEVSLRYFLQNSKAEQAEEASRDNKQRFEDLQQKLLDHMESVIVPDIRKRTGYQGDSFQFHWVYYEGEHIIEQCSEYRIPL